MPSFGNGKYGPFKPNGGSAGFWDNGSGETLTEAEALKRNAESSNPNDVNMALVKQMENMKREAMAKPADPASLYRNVRDQFGNLKSQYKLKVDQLHNKEVGPFADVTQTSSLPGLTNRLDGINLNTQGLQEIRNRATTQGTSTWGNLMLQQQQQEQSNAADSAASSSAGAAANSRSQLAMRGGLSGGAGERMSRFASRDAARAQQQVANQGITDRLGIRTKDEEQRLGLLTQLPGMEVNALQPELQKADMWSKVAQSDNDQAAKLGLANRDFEFNRQKYNTDNSLNTDKFNIGNAMDAGKYNIGNDFAENKQKTDFDLKRYEEQMKAWAAEKQAEATRNS